MTPPRRFPEAWRTLRFMFLTTIISISGVSALHLASRSRIETFENQYLQKCILTAAHIPLPSNPTELGQEFSRRIRPVSIPETQSVYYQVLDPLDQRVTGYVFKETGEGLWGEVIAIVGLDATGEHLTGIEILKHNETPGLGARIEEPAFKEQFRGKTGPIKLNTDTSPASNSEFDAITGATQSSRAILQILNKALIDARAQIKRSGG